jgi:hypothetical protein
MKGIDFKEANTRLLPPEGQEDKVVPLPIWTDGQNVMSKWKLTWKERLWVLRHGVLYLHVVGRTHPPLAIMAEDVWRSADKPKSGLRTLIKVFLASIAMWASIGFILWIIWGTLYAH